MLSEHIDEAARHLCAARRGPPLHELPQHCRPQSDAEAYLIQDAVMRQLGETVGGWKVGAPSADATPMFAPMPRAWIAANHAVLEGRHRYRGLEAEIAFLMGKDLPPRSTEHDYRIHHALYVEAVGGIRA